jgi:hypothetical protein
MMCHSNCTCSQIHLFQSLRTRTPIAPFLTNNLGMIHDADPGTATKYNLKIYLILKLLTPTFAPRNTIPASQLQMQLRCSQAIMQLLRSI